MSQTERIYCMANISLLETATVVSRYETQILNRTIAQSRIDSTRTYQPLVVTTNPMASSSNFVDEVSASMEPQVSQITDPSNSSPISSVGQHSVYDTTPELDNSSADTEPDSPIFPRRNPYHSDSSQSSTEDEILSQYNQGAPNMRTR